MDNNTITPDVSGLSRREMLIGAGILAAGYGVGQLMTAVPASGAPTVGLTPVQVNADGLEWPAAWSDPEVAEDAARLAALRGFDQFIAGGG